LNKRAIFEAAQQKDAKYFDRNDDIYTNAYIQQQWKWFQLGWDMAAATDKSKETNALPSL
jgi:hypothetical protein